MKLLCLLLIAILFMQSVDMVSHTSTISDTISAFSDVTSSISDASSSFLGFVEATSVIDTSSQAVSREDAGGNLGGLHDQKYRINCSAQCSRRCSRSSRRKICFRSCTGCCRRCNCVPPGTYGNTHLCPCYASIRTRGNRLKCP